MLRASDLEFFDAYADYGCPGIPWNPVHLLLHDMKNTMVPS